MYELWELYAIVWAATHMSVKISLEMRRTMSRIATILLLTVLFAAEASAAGALLDYEKHVFRAAEQIGRIKADADYSEEGISHIKELLPRSEQIEFEGRQMSVDNTWVYVLLDSYAAEKDPQQRIARLNEAAGRLRALDLPARPFYYPLSSLPAYPGCEARYRARNPVA